jgi:3-ketoacyl-CoA synthase
MAGGRGVIEGLGGKLGLTKEQTAASFNALYWYGNTSSGSLWYELSFIEACQKIRKGDTVWMVRFPSFWYCGGLQELWIREG